MILYTINLIVLLFILFNIFIFLKNVIYLRLLLPYIKKPLDLRVMGQWAVVTGCTDGIGKAFAIELAKLGLDIILISRTKKKLDELANELSETYGVKTKIIVADFTNSEKAIVDVEQGMAGVDIGVLVNNVGISAGTALFLKNDKREIDNMIEVNVKTTLRMSYLVMPIMLAKRKGVVINVSSLSAVGPCPYFSCYGATKAFIHKFSKDLHLEYKRFGITVHCLNSGFVATKMTNLPPILWFIPSAETYAKSALKTIGLNDVTTGHSFHDVFELYIRFLEQISPSFSSFLFDTLYSMNSNRAPSTAKQQANYA